MKKFIVGFLAFIGVLGIIAGILIAYFILKVDYKYTGEQLFNAVNEYRTSQNLPNLQLEPKLCDNLVARWLSIKDKNTGHDGFEEWLKKEEIADKYDLIGELYVKDISTPQNAINFWLSSPGHKNTLEMKEMVFGCSYANEGTGVLIVASQRTQSNI